MINPTQDIFQSPSIEFISGEYYKVMTTRPVKKDEILYIELVASGDKQTLAYLIDSTPILFNKLYPRMAEWCENNDPRLVCSKYSHNAFSLNNTKTLGLKISSFNHSTTPNAIVIDEKILIEEIEHTIHFKSVVANCNIPANTEIKILYSILVDDNCKFYKNADTKNVPVENIIENTIVVKKIRMLITLFLSKNLTSTTYLIISHHLFDKGISIFTGVLHINNIKIYKDMTLFFQQIGCKNESEQGNKLAEYLNKIQYLLYKFNYIVV